VALPALIGAPLRLRGCGLPREVVLLCRLLALALLGTDQARDVETPFLPFVPGLDALLPGWLFQRTLQVLLVTAGLGVLFTRRVRLFAGVLGGVMLLAVASSRTFYGNNKVFVGLLLLLSALSDEQGEPRLLRWQMALAYFGAGLNKLLDPDWQSGQFFEHWAADSLENPPYVALSRSLPPLVAGKVFSWLTIVVELALASIALVPRLRVWTIWGSGLFQSGLLLFSGLTFDLFFYAMQASLLAFAPWPAHGITVRWDGRARACAVAKRWMERLDLDGVFHWLPLAGEIAGRRGRPPERLYAAGPGWLLDGYAACRRMLIHLPLFWMLVLAAVGGFDGPWSRRAVVVGVLFFLSPLSNPIGGAVSRWVSRSRPRPSGYRARLTS
jgi:hypothetical protein